MSASVDIGLCVPVLNERESIEPLFADIASCLHGGDYTICVVDDGSTDGTVDLVKERARADARIALIERRKTAPGCRRGGASRAGLSWLLRNTSHAFFADVDADGANAATELIRAMDVASSRPADVVIASKYVRGAVVTGRPLIRRAGSRGYNLALRMLMDRHVRDYSNSFRVYRRHAAELLQGFQPLYDTPVYLVEMMAVWLAQGVQIVEMPTTYRERRAGASKVVPSDFLRAAVGAVRVGLAYRAGRYHS